MNIIEKFIENLKIKFNFLNRTNSSEIRQKVVDSQTGHVVGGDLNINQMSEVSLSNIEKQLLKLLYIEYKSGKYPSLKISQTHSELEIKDGQYVGMLNNSKYIKIDTEDYILKDDGIRYMDNLDQTQIDKIVLPEEQREWDKIMEIQKIKIEETRRRNMTNSSR